MDAHTVRGGYDRMLILQIGTRVPAQKEGEMTVKLIIAVA
jgi:hypothetical protein